MRDADPPSENEIAESTDPGFFFLIFSGLCIGSQLLCLMLIFWAHRYLEIPTSDPDDPDGMNDTLFLPTAAPVLALISCTTVLCIVCNRLAACSAYWLLNVRESIAAGAQIGTRNRFHRLLLIVSPLFVFLPMGDFAAFMIIFLTVAAPETGKATQISPLSVACFGLALLLQNLGLLAMFSLGLTPFSDSIFLFGLFFAQIVLLVGMVVALIALRPVYQRIANANGATSAHIARGWHALRI